MLVVGENKEKGERNCLSSLYLFISSKGKINFNNNPIQKRKGLVLYRVLYIFSKSSDT
jgi:hypothetical protein